DNGVRYFATMEIEYNEGEEYSAEEKLISTWFEMTIKLLLGNFEFDKLNIDVLQHPSPKLLPFWKFDKKEPYLWAHKWDGVKTRLLQTTEFSYMVSDLNYEAKVTSNLPYNNMYFHLEEVIIDGQPQYILFEFLEASYQGN